MKRITSALLIIVMLCGMCTISVGAYTAYDSANDYSKYENVICEAFDRGYIEPYKTGFGGNFDVYEENFGKTYLDDVVRYNGFFGYESIVSLYWDFGLADDDEITKMFNNRFDDGWNIHCIVYPTKVLEEAYYFKFGIDVWDVLNNLGKGYEEYLLSADNDYVVIRATGRGDRMPGGGAVIDNATELSDNLMYYIWHLENFEYPYEKKSEEMCAILEKGIVAGKEIVGFRYLGVTPPNLNEYYSNSDYRRYIGDWHKVDPDQLNGDVTLDIFDIIDNRYIWFSLDGGEIREKTIYNNQVSWTEEWFDGAMDLTLTLYDDYIHLQYSRCSIEWYSEIIFVPSFKVQQCTNDNIISVTLNGNKINFTQNPILENDRTLVPMRVIFETLNSTVLWDDITQSVTAVKGDIIINITIGNYVIYKNGQRIELDVPAMLINDTTYVPVRAISEAFNCIVNWNEDTNTVEIVAPDNNILNSTEASDAEKYYLFSFFNDYDDITYAVEWLGTNGARHSCYGNVQPYNLPGTIQDVINKYGQLWNFVIYNNRFYCLIGEGASVDTLAYIYSFDINGNDPILIADDAMNYSICYIHNDELYYSTWCTDYYEDDNYNEIFDRYYDGGVYKINLKSRNKTKIADKNDTDEYFSKVIYENFYKHKNNEPYYTVALSPDRRIMCYTDFNKISSGHALYYDSVNGETNFLLCEKNIGAFSITDNYLYYTIEKQNNQYGYDAHVYRIPRSVLIQ